MPFLNLQPLNDRYDTHRPWYFLTKKNCFNQIFLAKHVDNNIQKNKTKIILYRTKQKHSNRKLKKVWHLRAAIEHHWKTETLSIHRYFRF